MAAQDRKLVAGADIPQSRRVVHRSRDQARAIRAERNRGDRTLMAAQDRKLIAELTFHSRAVLSLEAVAKRVPSLLNVAAVTGPS